MVRLVSQNTLEGVDSQNGFRSISSGQNIVAFPITSRADIVSNNSIPSSTVSLLSRRLTFFFFDLLIAYFLAHSVHITGRWALTPKIFVPPLFFREIWERAPHPMIASPTTCPLQSPTEQPTKKKKKCSPQASQECSEKVSRNFDSNYGPHWLRPVLTSYWPISLPQNEGDHFWLLPPFL